MRRIAIVCVALAFVLVAVAVIAQDGGPRRTECRQWDEAFLSTFNAFVLLGFIVSASAGLASGLLGRRYWWATSPPVRIALSATVTFGVLAFCLLAVPRILGFGLLWFGGIRPEYIACQNRAFNATGLFGGLIGANVPAFAQWPAMTACLAAACSVGALVAYVVGRVVVSFRGLAATARTGSI